MPLHLMVQHKQGRKTKKLFAMYALSSEEASGNYKYRKASNSALCDFRGTSLSTSRAWDMFAKTSSRSGFDRPFTSAITTTHPFFRVVDRSL